MKLVSETVEYRRTNEVEGKNGKYYLHSFEDEKSTFTLYCKNPVTCSKGDSVKLLFEVGLFDGKPQYNLVGLYNGK